MNEGVTQNYNTQPNEQMHGSLKDSYDLHTNFKNVAAQVSHLHVNQLEDDSNKQCARFFKHMFG